MHVETIIWLAEIEDKIIRKHQVRPTKVEEVLQAQPHVRFMERGYRPGEDVHGAFGQTTGGRYLAVYFIPKKPSTVLVITAREMTAKEKRTYGKS